MSKQESKRERESVCERAKERVRDQEGKKTSEASTRTDSACAFENWAHHVLHIAAVAHAEGVRAVASMRREGLLDADHRRAA
eukprot:6200959-Pleurochrysis_carterae.AAC.4